MTVYLVVPLLIVVAIVQATIVPYLTIWGVFADLPVLVVVSWGLLRGAREGIIWGFLAGLALDLFSGAPFGAATLSLMAAGLIAGQGQTMVFHAHLVLLLVTMFLATIVYDLFFLLVVQITGQTVAWLDSLFRIVLPSAVLNTALAPVFFVTIRWLSGRLGRAEMEF